MFKFDPYTGKPIPQRTGYNWGWEPQEAYQQAVCGIPKTSPYAYQLAPTWGPAPGYGPGPFCCNAA